MKRCMLVCMLVLLLLGVIGSQASAAEMVFEPLAFQYILSARTNADIVSGRLHVFGETRTTEPVQSVKTSLVIQRRDGLGWVDLHWFHDTKTNASASSVSTSIAVTKGATYRVIGYHTVDHYGYRESATTQSKTVTAP